MRNILRKVFGVDKYIEIEMLRLISVATKSVDSSLREHIREMVEREQVYQYVAQRVESLTRYSVDSEIVRLAKEVVDKAWEERAGNEAFIDEVVDRIKRKQL